MSKRIIYDARWHGMHGIGRFAQEVLKRWKSGEALELVTSPTSPLDPFRLSSALKREKCDLFYSPGYNAPWTSDVPFAFTVHDLIHLEDKEQSTLAKKIFYQLHIKNALKRAEKVFTVSSSSKEKICEWGGIPEGKVIVVPNGVDPIFSPNASRDRGNYFLYVGNHKSHKNTVNMIRAFKIFSEKHPEINFRFVGEPTASIKSLIHELGLASQIECYSEIADRELVNLYQGAIGTILVSFIEGFGIPVVESLSCQTPVLVSISNPILKDLGSLPITAEPNSIDSISVGMEELLNRQFTQDENIEVERLRKIFDWNNISGKIWEHLQ